MNVPIKILCASGGLKHKLIMSRELFLIGPFKNTILQYLLNAYSVEPESCKMVFLNGSSFYLS